MRRAKACCTGTIITAPKVKWDVANKEPKVDPFQAPQYSNNAPWPGVGSSCSDTAPSYLPWYTSPTSSDEPRTSDLSPVSGYFDWSHSSNNTSPTQYDDIVGQPSPGATHHPVRIARPENQSIFVTGYPNARRSSWQNAPATSHCQQRQSVVADYSEPDNITVPTEHGTSTTLMSPISHSSKADSSSERNAREMVADGDSANLRSGKRWKAAHRAVERRYRSNLNLKIIKLGQCIPEIRGQVIGIDDLENVEDCRTTSKAKLQKGHVLSKAVDYIQSLQQLVSELEVEKRQLENRVESLHMMVDGDHQAPSEMNQRSNAPEASRHLLEPQISSRGRPKKDLSIPLKQVEPQTSSSEASNPLSPFQNGFSFVSENPSLTSKRPRVARGGVPRLSSA